MQRGKLIVIDGADGSGKATQTELLVKRLKDGGKEVATLDFPRYTQNTFGKLLRECLDGKRGNFMEIDPRIASTLYAADRFEAKPLLEKWLEAGKVVVLDRYVSANMLHQGAKIQDEDEVQEFLAWLDHVEHGIFGLPRPDVIIYLDVPYQVRFSLIQKDATREAVDVAEANLEHQIACEERAKSVVANTNTWHSINCTHEGSMRSREDIHEEIYRYVESLM